MSEDPRPRYSIIFNGELVKGVSRETALYRLAHLTNLSENELLERLFSVKPVIAAAADNYHLADTYREQFRQAGLKVETHVYDPEHDGIVSADLHFGHYAPLETQEIKPNFVIDTPAVATLKDSDIHHEGAQYRVVFNGQLTERFSRKQVIDNLCHLTNSSPNEVEESVFSAIPVVICQVDNEQLAEQYQDAFHQAGLVLERVEDDDQALLLESAPRCHLLIREDKPDPMRKKKMRTFTYALYGLAVLATIAWIAIYLVIDNYLKKHADKPIEIDLVYQATIKQPPVREAVELATPKPTAQTVKSKPKEPKPAKQPTPKKEPVKEQLPEPVKETQPKPTPAKPEKKPQDIVKPDPVQQQLRDEYNLQLLTWFAMFQQDNPLQSKYVEGEITLLVTVDRTGDLKNLKVLKSTSEELQRIVVMQFRQAEKIPGVPEKIPGDEYSFELPLRYRFN